MLHQISQLIVLVTVCLHLVNSSTSQTSVKTQNSELRSVAETHHSVPVLQICSNLCTEMSDGDSRQCRAYSYDRMTAECRLSTCSSVTAASTPDITIEVFNVIDFVFGGKTCGFEEGDSQCATMLKITGDVGGDDYDPIHNTGRTSSTGTGPSSAYCGTSYLYFETSVPVEVNQTANVRIINLPHSDMMLSFYYHGYGASMGSLTLHKSINNERPSQSNLLSTIFSGDQGYVWKLFETMIKPGDLDDCDTFELILVMRRGSDYTSDIAIDDITIKHL